jgi:ketosteroid isomerase-like protein
MVESERLARRYFSLLARGRHDELVEAVHPDVELALKTRPGEVLHGRDGVARFVEEIAERFYEPAAEVFRPLDGERIVVEGRIRWADDDRVLRDDPMVWALQFREGLLLRSIPAQTVLEAESVLATLREDEVSPS